jgi:hypothetical protein
MQIFNQTLANARDHLVYGPACNFDYSLVLRISRRMQRIGSPHYYCPECSPSTSPGAATSSLGDYQACVKDYDYPLNGQVTSSPGSRDSSVILSVLTSKCPKQQVTSKCAR